MLKNFYSVFFTQSYHKREPAETSDRLPLKSQCKLGGTEKYERQYGEDCKCKIVQESYSRSLGLVRISTRGRTRGGLVIQMQNFARYVLLQKLYERQSSTAIQEDFYCKCKNVQETFSQSVWPLTTLCWCVWDGETASNSLLISVPWLSASSLETKPDSFVSISLYHFIVMIHLQGLGVRLNMECEHQTCLDFCDTRVSGLLLVQTSTAVRGLVFQMQKKYKKHTLGLSGHLERWVGPRVCEMGNCIQLAIGHWSQSLSLTSSNQLWIFCGLRTLTNAELENVWYEMGELHPIACWSQSHDYPLQFSLD